MKKLLIVLLAFGFTVSAYGVGQEKTACHKSLSSLSRTASKNVDKKEEKLVAKSKKVFKSVTK